MVGKSKASPALGHRFHSQFQSGEGGGALMSRSLCCCACRRLRGEQSTTTPTDSDFYPSQTRPTPSALSQKRDFFFLKNETGETYHGRSFLDGLLASFASFPTTFSDRQSDVSDVCSRRGRDIGPLTMAVVPQY